MDRNAIQILWDNSHLWGIIAWRMIRAFGLPCSLVKAEKIAQGRLMRKPPAILLVPGGSARQKCARLGRRGMAAIRDYVKNGGIYMGFCGGAGLALSNPDPESGLGLCPWQRHNYANRLYHLVSGHIYCATPLGEIPLPVWWPGRFEPSAAKDVSILATCLKPGADIFISDLPVADIPPKIRLDWHDNQKMDMDLHLPNGLPIAIMGNYGPGKYFLSYAHLETPGSTAANRWLASILKDFTGAAINPAAPMNTVFPQTDNPPDSACGFAQSLRARIGELMNLGSRLGFFFRRQTWLWGWHAGAPGMVCNNLLASAAMLAELPESAALARWWKMHGNDFRKLAGEFCQKAEAYFWNYRLQDALATAPGQARSAGCSGETKNMVFGHPMHGGGMAGKLLDQLEIQLFLADAENLKTS